MKIQIIAHRTNSEEKTKDAIERGFGVEVDVRVKDNRLVCQHDPFDNSIKSDFTFERFLNLVQFANVPVAINVKEAGLVKKLNTILFAELAENSFVFDLSVPDIRDYLNHSKVKILERLSDIEFRPVFENFARMIGFWIDHFERIWPWAEAEFASLENYTSFEDEFKRCELAFVSPELHCYDDRMFGYWENIRRRIENNFFSDIGCKKVMLCTDHPIQANEFFNGKN